MVVVAAGYLYGFTLYVQIAGGLKGFVTSMGALDLARSGRMIVFATASTIAFVVLRKYRSQEPINYADTGSELLDISSDGAYWSAPRLLKSTPAASRQRSVMRFVMRFLLFVSVTVSLGVGFEYFGTFLDRRAFRQ